MRIEYYVFNNLLNYTILKKQNGHPTFFVNQALIYFITYLFNSYKS